MRPIESEFKIDFLEGEFIKSMVKIGDSFNFLSRYNFKFGILPIIRIFYLGSDFLKTLDLNGVDRISLHRRKKIWKGIFWFLVSLVSSIGIFGYFENFLLSFFASIAIVLSGIYLFFDYYYLNREIIFSVKSVDGKLDVVADADNYYEKILLVAKDIAYSCPDAVYRY